MRGRKNCWKKKWTFLVANEETLMTQRISLRKQTIVMVYYGLTVQTTHMSIKTGEGSFAHTGAAQTQIQMLKKAASVLHNLFLLNSLFQK